MGSFEGQLLSQAASQVHRPFELFVPTRVSEPTLGIVPVFSHTSGDRSQVDSAFRNQDVSRFEVGLVPLGSSAKVHANQTPGGSFLRELKQQDEAWRIVSQFRRIGRKPKMDD